MATKFVITPVPESERKPVIPDATTLPFGKVFTDHMAIMKFAAGKWQDMHIEKLHGLDLHPAALVLHYAQEIFEGLKAFVLPSGKIAIFRPQANIVRFNRSAKRLCMPEVDEEVFLRALKELVKVDARHVPRVPGTSLYIRPAMIASEAVLGVRPSSEYIFFIIASPVGFYYPDGFRPTKMYAQRSYVRAARGGTGDVKCGGNYAASLFATHVAKDLGCSQVLWLDAEKREFCEEVGSMNMFFVIDGIVRTAPLAGTILPGITRDSSIILLRSWGVPVEERAVSLDELEEGIKKGTFTEAFGTGTAASIAPVGAILLEDHWLQIGNDKVGPITQRLYDAIVGIQRGTIPDIYGWVVPVDD